MSISVPLTSNRKLIISPFMQNGAQSKETLVAIKQIKCNSINKSVNLCLLYHKIYNDLKKIYIFPLIWHLEGATLKNTLSDNLKMSLDQT